MYYVYIQCVTKGRGPQTDNHLPPKRRPLGFGVFVVIWSIQQLWQQRFRSIAGQHIQPVPLDLQAELLQAEGRELVTDAACAWHVGAGTVLYTSIGTWRPRVILNLNVSFLCQIFLPFPTFPAKLIRDYFHKRQREAKMFLSAITAPIYWRIY
jgi:hypothetical protein